MHRNEYSQAGQFRQSVKDIGGKWRAFNKRVTKPVAFQIAAGEEIQTKGQLGIQWKSSHLCITTVAIFLKKKKKGKKESPLTAL